MNTLRALFNRYAWLGPALGLTLAAVLIWQFTHYTPDDPAVLSRARQREINREVARHQQALGQDTTQANANHAAAGQALDAARQHAKHATRYHQQARHAKTPVPTTDADVQWLQRRLTDLYR